MNIPDHAIEAAAEGLYERAYGQELPEAPIDLARAALEAALPYVRAQIQIEWADYIDTVTGSVGNTLTFETLTSALRAPNPPFGHYAQEGTNQ